MLKGAVRKMPVPKISQLRKGIGVRIVLKADQRTGKLTTGKISDVLTRGDHPRGVKVRLTDGQVGRVQALAPAYEDTGMEGSVGNGVDEELEHSAMKQSDTRHSRGGGHRGRGGCGFQEGYGLGRAPRESLSLFDYVKTPSKAARVPTFETAEPVLTAQEQLESEFPKLDSALISAILVDYPVVTEARTVLSSLS
jgi:uncharacterized repeat protein (TIGR03833 family)